MKKEVNKKGMNLPNKITCVRLVVSVIVLLMLCLPWNEMKVEWKDMYKAYSTNQSIILATGKLNAWIFPKKDLKEDRYALIEMISTHMSPDKVKIKQ